MESRISKKRSMLLALAVGTIIVMVLLVLVLLKEKPINTGAQFFVSPTDTTVSINGTPTSKNRKGIIELAPGQYQVEITREYFDPQTHEITVVDGEITEVLAMLYPENHSEEGEALLRRPNEQENRESISYRLSVKRNQEIANKNPIIKLLPVSSPYWRIDYGVSQQTPGDPTKQALYITTEAVESRQDALDWIIGQGFDPTQFEIIYRFF